MILAFRYTPGPSAEHTNVQDSGDWLNPVYVADEKMLGNGDDGQYSVHLPSEATISEGPDADPQLAETFTFSHRVNVKDGKVTKIRKTRRVATAK